MEMAASVTRAVQQAMREAVCKARAESFVPGSLCGRRKREKPPPPAPGESKSESKVTWIEPIPHFAKGVKDSYSLQAGGPVESSADALKRIFSNAGPVKGDILLLVGSADCTSYRTGKGAGENKNETNTLLATERADKIEGELNEDAQKYGVEIRKKPLPQYNRCAEAGDLRAMFPFLIHPGSAAP
jgi:hypothetical protein